MSTDRSVKGLTAVRQRNLPCKSAIAPGVVIAARAIWWSRLRGGCSAGRCSEPAGGLRSRGRFVFRAFDRALCLLLRRLAAVAERVDTGHLCLVQIEPVDCLGEAQVGIQI